MSTETENHVGNFEAEDVLRCGKCGGTFHELEIFVKHKISGCEPNDDDDDDDDEEEEEDNEFDEEDEHMEAELAKEKEVEPMELDEELEETAVSPKKTTSKAQPKTPITKNAKVTPKRPALKKSTPVSKKATPASKRKTPPTKLASPPSKKNSLAKKVTPIATKKETTTPVPKAAQKKSITPTQKKSVTPSAPKKGATPASLKKSATPAPQKKNAPSASKKTPVPSATAKATPTLTPTTRKGKALAASLKKSAKSVPIKKVETGKGIVKPKNNLLKPANKTVLKAISKGVNNSIKSTRRRALELKKEAEAVETQESKVKSSSSSENASKSPTKSKKQSLTLKKTKKSKKNDVYTVEKIVDMRIQDNQKEFLIKWSGFDDSDNTWEPEAHISDELVADFENDMKTPKTGTKRKLTNDSAKTSPRKRQKLDKSEEPKTPTKNENLSADEFKTPEKKKERTKIESQSEEEMMRSESDTPTRGSRSTKTACMDFIHSVCQYSKKKGDDLKIPKHLDHLDNYLVPSEKMEKEVDKMPTSTIYLPKPDDPGNFIIVIGEPNVINKLETANLNPSVILNAKQPLRKTNFDSPVKKKARTSISDSVKRKLVESPAKKKPSESSPDSKHSPALRKKLENCPPLKECCRDFIPGALQLPNVVQIVESELPIKEAENSEKLIGMFVFRQVISSSEKRFHCLICRNKTGYSSCTDLEKHYLSIHDFTCQVTKAEFNEKIVFVCIPMDVDEETALNSKCRFCSYTLKTLSEVRDHYPASHNRKVRLVPESDLATIAQNFFCSICSHSAVDFHVHHNHMKTEHRMQTYVCKKCNYCSSREDRLRIHYRQKHLQAQSIDRVQCSLCAVSVNKDSLNKHLLQFHAVKTGSEAFTCTKCLISFLSTDEYLAHIFECKDAPPTEEENNLDSIASPSYKCVPCCTIFSTLDELKIHKANKTDCNESIVNDDLTCFLCNMTFTDDKQCQSHYHHAHKDWVKSMSNGDVDPKDKIENYDVESYIKTCPTKKQLKEMGYPTKVGNYCTTCDKVISHYGLYSMHMSLFHGFTKKFKCIVSACGKTFDGTMEYQHHSNQHNPKTDFFCDTCDEIFSSEKDLEDHANLESHMKKLGTISEKTNRSNTHNHRCQICQHWFGLKRAFIFHMECENHNYLCKHCGSRFIQPIKRKNHIQSFHPDKTAVCDFCNQKLKSYQALLGHLVLKHPEQNFCEQCGKQYLSKEILEQHKKSHLVPHLCSWEGCDLKFPSKISLFNHMKIHESELISHKCKICSKEFSKKKMLDLHMKNHTSPKKIQSRESASKSGSQNETSIGSPNKISNQKSEVDSEITKEINSTENREEQKEVDAEHSAEKLSSSPKKVITKEDSNDVLEEEESTALEQSQIEEESSELKDSQIEEESSELKNSQIEEESSELMDSQIEEETSELMDSQIEEETSELVDSQIEEESSELKNSQIEEETYSIIEISENVSEKDLEEENQLEDEEVKAAFSEEQDEEVVESNNINESSPSQEVMMLVEEEEIDHSQDGVEQLVVYATQEGDHTVLTLPSEMSIVEDSSESIPVEEDKSIEFSCE